MKKQFILCFVATAILLSFSSCKMDDEPSIEAQPVYLPMTVGNYWIYQHFIVDSLGNETPYNVYDSVYIVKDSLINNNRYYEFDNSISFSTFKGLYRDSLGYLVKSTGEILFSATNFTDTIHYDYFYNREYRPNRPDRLLFCVLKTKMNPEKQVVSTPLSEYNTLMVNGFVTYYYYDNFGNIIETINTNENVYYAPNIGLIKDTYHYYTELKRNKSKVERRLIRYKLKE